VLRAIAAILAVSIGLVLLAIGAPRAETICEVQAYSPADGLSPLNGRTVTVKGIATVPTGVFQPLYTSIYIRGVGDDRCGVNVFSRTRIAEVNLGDTVVVRGVVEEYISTGGNGAITELTFSTESDVSVKRGTGPPEPEVLSTGQAGRESNEGRLVRVTGQVVTAVLGSSFSVDDGTGEIEIYDFGLNFASDSVWTSLEFGSYVTVTGVISQADPDLPYLSGYRINPRRPSYGDVVTPQCIPGGSPRALLNLSGSVFSPEYGEKIRITYNGPNAARVRLRIFDGYGRCVATLDDRISLCGQTEFLWDGRNEIRQELPSGLYHVVVTAIDPETGGESQETVPVVIGRRLK
jgi:hypothetical protein